MQSTFMKATLNKAALAVTILLLAAATCPAQTVNLTAGRYPNTILPDGSTVPMWGFACDAVNLPTGNATCAALNKSGAWAPPVITVPANSNLTITLKNTLTVPTSIVIVGQVVGGGLGSPTTASSPTHAQQGTTWPIAGAPGPDSPTFTPPKQGDRVQSFGTEVLPGAQQDYPWTGLKPGTYLIETGTHPSIQGPMGLYGVLVVTNAPTSGSAGDAYPAPASPKGVPYDADAVLLLSEIDPVQNAASDAAAQSAGFKETTPWTFACGQAKTCYPPAVNYSPLYFLVNGSPFDRTQPGNSGLSIPAASYSGNVLLRFVNAGLRLHVPTVVGLDMALVAEDGNVLPGNARVQNEVLLPAGKIYDVLVNPPVTSGQSGSTYNQGSYAIFDRELSLSANNQRDGGMQAYLLVNGAAPPATAQGTTAKANPDSYYLTPGNAINVSDASSGLLANDVNVYGVKLDPTSPPNVASTLALNPDGTFSYTPGAGVTSDTFGYCGNGATTGAACTTVTLAACTGQCVGGTPVANADAFSSSVAKILKVHRPGVLANDVDPSGHPLTAVLDGACTAPTGATVLTTNQLTLNSDGSFTATPPVSGAYYFCYHAVNSQQSASASTSALLTFQAGTGLQVTVQDVKTKAPISDYSWVIEEDTNFHTPAGVTPGTTPSLATSFHSSFMPLVASGCVGDVSCRRNPPETVGGVVIPGDPDTTPADVVLDPSKYYYVSILPGDAANPFINGGGAPVPVDPNNPDGAQRQFDMSKDCTFDMGTGTCGHTMAGTTISPGQLTATIKAEQSPLQPAQLSIFVFEDDFPTNGDIDSDEVAKGLGGFQIILNDVAGATGDATGQMTYDMFNMPLTNALANKMASDGKTNLCPQQTGPSNIAGMIITCPEKDSAGNPSPLAGQALIQNLFPNRFDVFAFPSAEREGNGENWIQTSTLEGTHANDAFAKNGEPSYFQEFGPPGFHSFIGFVNPAHIAASNAALPGSSKYTIKGKVTNLHMSRPWSVTLFDSASHDPISQSTCYVGANAQNGVGQNVAFAACDSDGNFSLTGLPTGSYQIVVWDQWLDQIIEYKTATVNNANVDMGNVPVFSWFQSVYTSTYIDENQNGVRDGDESGLNQVPIRIRYRNGAISNTNGTDNQGNAAWAEVFPLFNWYVMESDTTRYKGTGVHTANDAGGAVDTTGAYEGWMNTSQPSEVALPANLRFPGSIYCDTADCASFNISNPPAGGGPGGSTGRIDPGSIVSEGFQAFISQPQYIDWGKTPYVAGENGGIIGHVAYGSTRPFDDPQLLFQNLWEPLVPRVTINLYQEATAADGTQSLTLVDTTQTSSWDDWANGKRPDGNPNMNCAGQDPNDPYYKFSLGTSNRYKCYDGFHAWNQMEPAVYDGRYQFPSPAYIANHPLSSTQAKNGQTLVSLPAGKYVVEVMVPQGYEIVKEEDKNILIGDSYIAPVTQQFGGLGSIFIMPDQAAVNAFYNPNNSLNPTTNLGRNTASLGDFGPGGLTVQPAPCVGTPHTVPDFLTLFPGSQEVAPFAGAIKNLCDRKEIRLGDQMQAATDFFVFTQTPISAHYAGMILDDASAEFNTAAPDFGEKFAVPFVPVSFRDFNGVEISRTYSDQYGMYNGLVYSTWAVNPPNPTGYAPNMTITCMNDPGPISDPNHPGQLITDPMYNPNYSNFCYTLPFMPGNTSYLDTPVLPVAAFAAGYNPVDCAYPDATPAILRVDSSAAQFGPWITTAGGTLTITALGDVQVPNNAYSGPFVTGTGLDAQKTVLRHYGFGSNTTGNGSVALVNNTTGASSVLATTLWSDGQITATVPANLATGTYELAITAENGKKSIDTVMVTVAAVDAKPPIYVNPPDPAVAIDTGLLHPIQDAIDAAQPGDMIMLNGSVMPSVTGTNAVRCDLASIANVTNAAATCGAANYPELVIMYKPVRLQGVGAASVIINATKYPTQKLETWRSRINTLFGLDSQGNTLPGTPQVDPLPGQEITGGILLLEPSVLGTEEGAGITVLAKGLRANGTPFPNCSGSNRVPGNFLCAPASIDGISITGGDAGGGIYVNGWAHNLAISNNRIYGNAGTFSGGVRIGQPYLEGQALPPAVGPRFGFGYDNNISIHHNKITNNGTIESNIGENGGGGGVSICSGTDNYALNYNFICGNYSQGDGGGVGHIGLSNPGTIAHNQIIFNQSFFQGQNTSGGGIVIEGESSTLGGLSIGTGSVTVDANLIQGNQAGGGHGGGIRLQNVNGADVSRQNRSGMWNVQITNNMIVNNVAGWAGGGLSLSDVSRSSIFNNTIENNDSTATVGAVFTSSPTQSSFQPAGISSELHSPGLAAATNQQFSNPTLANNIIWHNRSFYFQAGATDATGATSTTLMPALTSQAGYACPAGANYWDLGVLGQPQASPALRLNPVHSILSDTTGYDGSNLNTFGPTSVMREYCNGPRVNPGATDTTPSAPPVQFAMQPAAAEDEGGNWIDLRFGPLSLSDSSISSGNAGYGTLVGDYHLAAGSQAINQVACNQPQNTRISHDFDGDTRPQPTCSIPLVSSQTFYDIGADEVGAAQGTVTFAPSPANFGTITVGTTKDLAIVGTVAGASVTFNSAVRTGSTTFSIVSDGCSGTTVSAGSTCTITVRFTPGISTLARTGTLTVNDNAASNPQTIALTGQGARGRVSVNPNPVAFNAQPVGTPVPMAVTVSNSGAAALTINSDAVTGTNFTKGTDGCAGITLQPADTCTVNVIFTPTIGNASTGSSNRFGTLAIVSNASNAIALFNITGTAVQAVVGISAPSPSMNTGGTNVKNATITVSNTGGAALNVTGATISKTAGPAAGVFSVTGGSCLPTANVQPGQSCTVGVSYNPNSTTTSSTGHLVLTDTGAAAGSQSGGNFNAN
jgi:hypothetical protein